MCRLFGLISNRPVDIEFSMVGAQDNFKKLGESNPDGWGIGWYKSIKPIVKKYGENIIYSKKFDSILKSVNSKIIFSHIRKRSDGIIKTKNSQPFTFRNYIFAHNGTLRNKDELLKMLKPPYNKNFQSDSIDSEIYFRLLAQNIAEKKDVLSGIKETIKYSTKASKGANFILSDGKNIYAFKHGEKDDFSTPLTLYYLKRDFSEDLNYSSKEAYNFLIQSKSFDNKEKAVIVCSEKLTKDEKWKSLNNYELLIVQKDLSMSVLNCKRLKS